MREASPMTTAAEIKARLDAACAAESARIRADLSLPPDTPIDFEMSPYIAALFDEYEAALAAEGKPSAWVTITE